MHDVLTHLAGQVPDRLLESARDRLADGDLPEVGRLIRFGRAEYGCTVTPECYDALRTVLTEDESATLVFPRNPVPPYDFRDAVHDDTDLALVETAALLEGVRGLWRAWRIPLGVASWPDPVRIVLVESDGDPVVPRRALRATADVIVEVLVSGVRWPEYHQRALAASALLWAANPRPGPRVAPGTPDGRVRVPDARFDRFLNAGVDLPGGWSTDGAWVWPTAYTVLDATHGPLYRHARARGFVVGEVDGVARHQAMVAVRRVTTG